MTQRRKIEVDSSDIERAIDELEDRLNIDSLSDVDKFFALDLLRDYGRTCGVCEATWRSIDVDGVTKRESSGGKGNRHYKMVKSEALDIFKSSITMKIALAAKISKFVSSGLADVVEEEKDAFDEFNS